MFPQAPTIGVADMIHPAFDTGIQFGEADRPTFPGIHPLAQMTGSVARILGTQYLTEVSTFLKSYSRYLCGVGDLRGVCINYIKPHFNTFSL